tara:strand:- start:132 stop:374 length:243 start_codon:yes stop_codon:yes gene_type:complete
MTIAQAKELAELNENCRFWNRQAAADIAKLKATIAIQDEQILELRIQLAEENLWVAAKDATMARYSARYAEHIRNTPLPE